MLVRITNTTTRAPTVRLPATSIRIITFPAVTRSTSARRSMRRCKSKSSMAASPCKKCSSSTTRSNATSSGRWTKLRTPRRANCIPLVSTSERLWVATPGFFGAAAMNGFLIGWPPMESGFLIFCTCSTAGRAISASPRQAFGTSLGCQKIPSQVLGASTSISWRNRSRTETESR